MCVKRLTLVLTGVIGLVLGGCAPSGPGRLQGPDRALKVSPVLADDSGLVQDWPQWRYDANRSANSPHPLPGKLHPHWTRQYSRRAQVWDDPLNHDLMPYDRVFEPVVMGARMFIGFNDRDKVVALDIRSGAELWTFYTDGPVRMPPAAWQGKVYFASDDGLLYCVNARDGSLVWASRGGPSDRKVLGNGRIISAWPARGGPVVRDGVVYFAASIWPFMGTFIYALDANTGRKIWENTGTSAQYVKQPHSTLAFGGVAPQGPLAATRDVLLVPGGRSVPAGFDRKTGRFLFFQFEDSGKGNGGSFVSATDSEFFSHTRRLGTRVNDLKTGKKGEFTINEAVLTTNRLFSAQESSALKLAMLEAEAKLLAARQVEVDAKLEVARIVEEQAEKREIEKREAAKKDLERKAAEKMAAPAKAPDKKESEKREAERKAAEKKENEKRDAEKKAYKDATNALASATRKVGRAETELGKARKALGTNWAGAVVQAVGGDKKVRWELPVLAAGDIIKAGQRLYAASSNEIVTIELLTNKLARIVDTNRVDGQVGRLIAANDMLFAVTLDGRILSFGGDPIAPEFQCEQCAFEEPSAETAALAQSIVESVGDRKGYALCYSVEDDTLLEALAKESDMHIVAVDANAARLARLRERLDAAGLYGRRVVLHLGDPLTFRAPPYVASLIVVGEPVASRFSDYRVLQAVYESLRPFGGILWLPAPPGRAAGLATRINKAALPQAKASLHATGLTVVREGPLPGSADWTHQYGNVANTVKSDDSLVKLPLGLLWFGGPSHTNVLPRHGHGPSEQIAGGRLFIEGESCLSARDVYTGRVLWKADFENLGNFGVYFDSTYTNLPLSTVYNQKHIPGANARGANFVATPEEVFVVFSNVCQVLDARTGRPTRILQLPRQPGETQAPGWAYLGVCGDMVLGGAEFAQFTSRFGLATTNQPTSFVDLAASRRLVALDRQSGRVLWSAQARHSFPHNGIAVGGGRVYCLDRLPKTVTDKLKRRGRTAPSDYRLVAFDAGTGKLTWETTNNVFGTWLSYSGEHGLLLQAGAAATDRLADEADKGLAVYRGTNGALVWAKLDQHYSGPCILMHDTILTTPTGHKTNNGAFSLLDGKVRTVPNPLIGRQEPWRIYRTYGCSYPVANDHVMTFRSGAAGFYDLENHGGTGNFGGFKSGCSPNVIAACGVLNAPDFTRTCSCPYQNQTSLAMIQWPELETWTHNQYGSDLVDGIRVKRLGVNFGAPGDRLAETGTLWLDFPSVGGTSPNLMIAVKGSHTNYFCRNSLQMQGEGHPWVIASGVFEPETILIAPETRKPGPPPPIPKRKSVEDDDDYDEPSQATNTVAEAKTSGSKTNKTTKTEKPYRSVLPPAFYTVRLYFAEPDPVRSGERVFDVLLQDRCVLKSFDVVAQTGGVQRGVVREFNNVLVKGELAITFHRAKGARYGPLICGVEMVLEEERAGLESNLPANP